MKRADELADAESVIEQISKADRRTAARLLTRIEANDPSVTPALKALYLIGGNTNVVGITGPPGAGKSTLINSLVRECRSRGQTVAVLAVDPSSPFTGGSILGDRVRMNQHYVDPGVFIRSMATRGYMGGLAKAAADAITVLDAMGFDLLIVETVGVGQSEVDIVRHANTVLLVQPPHSGDRIQAGKSGVMEIADIFVVNKSDLPGADESVRAIREMVRLHYHGARWEPPIIVTQATAGVGIDKVMEKIGGHRSVFEDDRQSAGTAMVEKVKFRISEICEEMVRRQVMDQDYWSDGFAAQIEDICQRRMDPYSLAETLVAARAGMKN